VAQAQVSGIASDFRGANNYRPNVIGDPYGDRESTTSYFNRASFAIPDPSQPFGDAGRNTVRGPNFWQVDLAALVVFRRHGVGKAHGFRAPLYPWSVLLFVLAAVYVVGGSVMSNPANAVRGAALLAAGVPVYLFWRRRSRAR
jgi:hypothetical protein